MNDASIATNSASTKMSIRFGAVALCVCTFVSGAAVMLYEFLAVRILARYFGSALEVWAAEISVCLAGLSVGYAVGGVIADRKCSLAYIGLSMFIAGISAFAIFPVATWCGERLLMVDYGLQWHPLLAALASSFLPIAALGMVLPQAVRIAAKDVRKVGSATGKIAAISTMGSILGVLGVTSLLSRWDVRDVLSATSITLIFLGVLVMLLNYRIRPATAVLALFFLSVPTSHAQIIYERYTAHHHILVQDSQGERKLRFDNAVQSTMSKEDPNEGGFDYTDFFHVPVVFNPTMDRVLFFGLGGGTGPKSFLRNYPKMQIEVVEIDPVVEEVAKTYFSLPDDPRLRVTIQDARVYLNRTQASYGSILMDAYASGRQGAYLPYHLATLEFFTIVRAHLDDGGAFYFNVIGRYGGDNTFVVESILATLRATFESVYIFQAETSYNTLMIAVKQVKQVKNAAPQSFATTEPTEWPNGPYREHPVTSHKLTEMTSILLKNEVIKEPRFPQKFGFFGQAQYAQSNVQVLTDNYAPVDLSGGGRRRR